MRQINQSPQSIATRRPQADLQSALAAITHMLQLSHFIEVNVKQACPRDVRQPQVADETGHIFREFHLLHQRMSLGLGMGARRATHAIRGTDC